MVIGIKEALKVASYAFHGPFCETKTRDVKATDPRCEFASNTFEYSVELSSVNETEFIDLVVPFKSGVLTRETIQQWVDEFYPEWSIKSWCLV